MFKTLFFLFTLLATGKEFTQCKISRKKENKEKTELKHQNIVTVYPIFKKVTI